MYESSWKLVKDLRNAGYTDRSIGQSLLELSKWVTLESGPKDYYKHLLWCEVMGKTWRREFEERFAGELDFEALARGEIVHPPRTLQ